jgi:hypothetical protein
MNSSLGFLRKYIIDNPESDIIEILNDDEFLDELKVKDESFLN